jgi:hypothetical protein
MVSEDTSMHCLACLESGILVVCLSLFCCCWNVHDFYQLGSTKANPKVIWTKFFTLSLAVSVMNLIAWHTQARLQLELKTWLRFQSLSLSMFLHYSKLERCIIIKKYKLYRNTQPYVRSNASHWQIIDELRTATAVGTGAL